ncbi:hypothetical protein HOD05_00340 [Candidatus Woesearchaeota archaeon]|jgi:cytosolic 5'-nucleotidase 3|nr:hypothetical protein [Candidatus Woesearchaeota archaeon]MBT4150859.1 hypothetical protein [Candidatus Woesearchaeota archaeon]MBT4246964.1 hypothetical protein [Candidatus Woesearchaeota archaeon]MBT4433649.1 hypothetical protein [Candidatus Woesearchaeota archaeon]
MALYIQNPEELKRKLGKFNKDNFHVVSDFDKTLTKAFVQGKKVLSSYSLIREGNYLSPDYVKQAYALFDKYHPYEISNTISLDKKKKYMDQWWKEHWELMWNSGMNQGVLEDVISKGKLELRSGAEDFFTLLGDVPILIFSAGFGNLIELYLKSENLMKPNVHLVANFFTFSEDGKIKEIPEHYVHTFNKNEYEISSTPYQKEITKKSNVILLGDSLGDLGMTEGMNHDEVIRIGFLNDKIEELLGAYSEKFDVVITEDGSFEEVNEILRKILH